MSKSLIDAIGRKKASTLMENAVLRAINENRALGSGLDPYEKPECIMGDVTWITWAGNTSPLASGQRVPERTSSLNKSTPIA